MFADPQPRNRAEVDYLIQDVLEEMVGTDASFGVTLGDIMFDDLSCLNRKTRKNTWVFPGITSLEITISIEKRK